MLDFKEELKKISEQSIDTQFTNHEKEVSAAFEALNGTVTKLFKKQGAMSMQVEEMYSLLEEQENEELVKGLEDENSKLVNTLIAAADLVEDFYLYYKEHQDETMTIQSAIMWNTLCKTMAASGLIRISDENTPFNMHLNTIEGVTDDLSYPNNFIVRVLKSGYQYHGKIFRKAAVIVNKLEDKKE